MKWSHKSEKQFSSELSKKLFHLNRDLRSSLLILVLQLNGNSCVWLIETFHWKFLKIHIAIIIIITSDSTDDEMICKECGEWWRWRRWWKQGDTQLPTNSISKIAKRNFFRKLSLKMHRREMLWEGKEFKEKLRSPSTALDSVNKMKKTWNFSFDSLTQE